jgi:hypothetical protein
MTVIHKVGNIVVKKIQDNKYSITKTPFFSDFLSAPHFQSVHENDDTIFFRASAIQTLSQYLSGSNSINNVFCMKMIYDLGSQILFMERKAQGIPFFNLEDIIVIDHHSFLFLNTEYTFSLDSQKNLEINRPFKLSKFSAPELKSIQELPAISSHKAIFYSLAAIILHCLQVGLEVLKPTKLYFFLDRCLEEDPANRMFLYI